MRGSGILLPIASLPSRYGIGCFSKEAYEFVDQLKEAGQKFWQILPLGPTGYGDSPYQSFSTFAGNPYFIDLQSLIEEGYLTMEECDACDFGADSQCIDYGLIYQSRFKVLRIAYERWRNEKKDSDKEYVSFKEASKEWLPDYALYMAVKASFGGASYKEWDDDIRLRNDEAMSTYKMKYQGEVQFFEFQQYMFFKQWKKLKTYANEQGIKIIGDIPIYVAYDSADSWANPKLFQFDENNTPVAVAGCPPDAFAATGQLWGNPLYDWEYHKRTGYDWWIRRIKHCFQLYDVVRVDHFRGFDEYYAIPYGEATAENGVWVKGPGYEIFRVMEERLGKLNIIAEDLGFLTNSVMDLVRRTGYPGMKVLQFAFDSRETSDYLPHNYEKNCIVYTGTHDNDTVQGWFHTICEQDRKYAMEYINVHEDEVEDINWAFIRLAMSCVANLCIIPMQDYLGLGKDARINMPSTLGQNWTWRMTKEEFTEEIRQKIKKMTKLYAR